MLTPGAPAGAQVASSAPSPGAEAQRDSFVLCARCRAALTEEAKAVERFGGHEHERVNPSGFVFRLQVFAAAPGVRCVGPESTEFPWFPHHAWSIASCSGCGAHVGWRFSREEAVFFALIAQAIERA